MNKTAYDRKLFYSAAVDKIMDALVAIQGADGAVSSRLSVDGTDSGYIQISMDDDIQVLDPLKVYDWTKEELEDRLLEYLTKDEK